MATKSPKTNDKATDISTTDVENDKVAKTEVETNVMAEPTTDKVNHYTVQWQLHHNGKVYHQGDDIMLSDVDAKALLPLGVIVTA